MGIDLQSQHECLGTREEVLFASLEKNWFLIYNKEGTKGIINWDKAIWGFKIAFPGQYFGDLKAAVHQTPGICMDSISNKH
jgi:hypothetical protein